MSNYFPTVPLIVSILLTYYATCTTYNKHSLISVNLKDADHNQLIRFNRVCDELNIDLWDEPRPGVQDVHFRVSPFQRAYIEGQLKDMQLSFRTLSDNIQNWIDEEKNQLVANSVPRYGEDFFDIATYHPFEEIEKYLMHVTENLPNRTQLTSIGRTAEGRNIWLIKLIHSTSNSIRKPVIWVDAGIHAREWVAPATAIYLLNRLMSDDVVSNSRDINVQILRESFDWYIVPVLNPDGYVHSWTKDRLWRVDLNRNFEVGFGGPMTSGNPCSHSFKGDRAFSEMETLAVRNTLLSIREDVKVYVSLHSYSQLWMIPYAHTMEKPANYESQIQLLKKVTEAVKAANGQSYSFGTMSSMLYPAGGASPDWVYKLVGVSHSYLVELRDKGQKGFLLPADQIVPTGEEFLEGLSVIAKSVLGVQSYRH
ncbi:Carboxypeptidase A2 [Halotydeus destructor]|nr:Carboxypeptidase A2 [Halotydeus destructor]